MNSKHVYNNPRKGNTRRKDAYRILIKHKDASEPKRFEIQHELDDHKTQQLGPIFLHLMFPFLWLTSSIRVHEYNVLMQAHFKLHVMLLHEKLMEDLHYGVLMDHVSVIVRHEHTCTNHLHILFSYGLYKSHLIIALVLIMHATLLC
ncbi:hypothetical protein ACJX0J_015957 [Zea mays]